MKLLYKILISFSITFISIIVIYLNTKSAIYISNFQAKDNFYNDLKKQNDLNNQYLNMNINNHNHNSNSNNHSNSNSNNHSNINSMNNNHHINNINSNNNNQMNLRDRINSNLNNLINQIINNNNDNNENSMYNYIGKNNTNINSSININNDNYYNNKEIVYVISITKETNFFDGIAVLAYSIINASQTSKYSYTLYAFLLNELSYLAPQLESYGFHVIYVNIPTINKVLDKELPFQYYYRNGCCGLAELIKLYVYKLDKFYRVIHLDIDTMLIKVKFNYLLL